MTAEGEGKPGHCWVVRCGICFRLPKIQCTRVMITLTVSNSRNHFSPTIHTIWTPGINLRGDTQAMVVMCLVYSFDSPGSYPHMSIGVQSFHVIARRDCTCSHTSVFDAVRVKYWKGTYSVTFVTSVPWHMERVLRSWPCYELQSSYSSFEEIWDGAAKRPFI